jgi:succinylglutamate desuccinylase
MAYRDRMTRFAEAAQELHGIKHPREPRLLIVLGRMSALQQHQRLVLQELNRSLHRAEIVPYDIVAKRAERTLDNIITYLGGSRLELQRPAEDADDGVLPTTDCRQL